MDAALVSGWNDKVAPGDDVVVLGDLAMGRIADSLSLVSQLNGTKTLVAGNHDRCWSGHRKGADKWVDRYLEAGFVRVAQGTVDVDLGPTLALADHFPYQGDSHDEDRYAAHRPTDRGRWLLHGHVHEKWRQHGRQINVGVDAWGGRPVSDDRLVELIAAGPADLAPLPWD